MLTKTLLAFAAGAVMAFAVAGTSQAQSLSTDSTAQASASLIYVADGCGPGWYRGPGGACHRFGRGPYPWGYGPSPHHWNPCFYLGRGGRRCWLN